jgi:hypothetical protein
MNDYLSRISDLFSIVGYRLQDGTQSFKTNCHIKQMSCEEEVVEVPKNGECKVPQAV